MKQKFSTNKILGIALSILALGGCSKQAPAVFNSYGVNKGAGSVGIHTVLPGDTVYKIAKNYQLPMREIITINNIQAPYALNTGYRMKLPPPNEYEVREGDTVASIARLYEVSPNRLASLNNLSAPYDMQVGQVVRLPSVSGRYDGDTNDQASMRNVAMQSPDIDTSVGRARVGGVERQTLDAPNTNSDSANAGAPISTSAGDVARKTAQASAGAVTAPGPDMSAGTETVSAGVVVPKTKPRVTEVSVSRAKLPDVTPKMSGKSKFMRPVDGKIISSYGAKANGLHNDGINIKAVRGTPVRAAENGVVVYNGDDLEGYGNLVLIRHENKMMSAYAHLDKTLVKRGAKVVRGQSIGTVGSTGQVDTPQLHFEIRRGSTPLNPAKYL